MSPLNLDDHKKEGGEPESASVGEVAEVEPLTDSPPPLRSYEHGGPLFRNVGSTASSSSSSSSSEEEDELSAGEDRAQPRIGVFFEAKVGEYPMQLRHAEASASCDSQEQAGPAHPPPPLSSESAAKQQRTGQAVVEAKVGEAPVGPVGFRAQSLAVAGQGGIGNAGGMLQLR